MAPTDKRKEPSMLAALGLASGIGLQLAATVLVGLGLGYLADRDPKINNSLMRRRRSPRRF